MSKERVQIDKIDFISKYVAETDSLSKNELLGGYDLQIQQDEQDTEEHIQVQKCRSTVLKCHTI